MFTEDMDLQNEQDGPLVLHFTNPGNHVSEPNSYSDALLPSTMNLLKAGPRLSLVPLELLVEATKWQIAFPVAIPKAQSRVVSQVVRTCSSFIRHRACSL